MENTLYPKMLPYKGEPVSAVFEGMEAVSGLLTSVDEYGGTITTLDSVDGGITHAEKRRLFDWENVVAMYPVGVGA